MGRPSQVTIVTAFDANFAELAGVMLHSLSKQPATLARISDIWALVHDVPAELQAQVAALSPRPIRFVDVGPLLRNRLPDAYCDHITLVSYARLFLPDLRESDARILYIDADTLVVGCLVELIDLAMDGCPIAAAPTFGSWARRKIATLGLPAGARYLNAGVLLIDPAAWRRLHLTEKAVEAVIANGKRPWNHDQDALAIALQDNWKSLERRWNMRAGDYRFLSRFANDPRIVHFTGTKPTHHRCSHPDRARFRAMRAETPFGREPVVAGPAPSFAERWRAGWRLVNRGLREAAFLATFRTLRL